MVLQKMPPPYGGDKAFREKKNVAMFFQEEPCWDYFHMASPCVLGDL